MLKRELKVNFKSFLIWTGLLIALYLAVFLVYPSIANSDNIQMMDEMMKLFPEEMLKAFNMDLASMDTAFGWLKTEGLIFILLLTGIYASIMGSSIVLKEENDKTIEYLNMLPISRKKIMKDKVICSLIYIVMMTVCLGIFNYIALLLSGDFNQKQYWLLSISPLMASLPLFAINLYIASLSRKTKKTFSISLGITLVSYFIQILSEMNEVTKWFRYFTVYTLSDVRNIIANCQIDGIMIVISFIISTIFIWLSFQRYENKEFL